MANLLKSVIANQPINPAMQGREPSFTIDTKGKVKPLEDKGRLLPSRIFGSPVEYAKDLKKDVISIGKAAKGKANDHELGRINDLAMKLGSLGLATYLFVKNPFKLSKAMEFVGFGTFFASMALWPKLAIQAPLKLRTGVDIHQKYIDAQGRKKMLHQDPQYDLTDLYSRADLDKMGEKLGVDENLPDRDSFIKQRAKKTAIQGNTLWMLTAGFATPLTSALACNALEKPIGKAIEQYDLVSSSIKMNKGSDKGVLSKVKQMIDEKALESFIRKNANSQLDDKMIAKLATKIGGKANSASLEAVIREELKALSVPFAFDEAIVREKLAGVVDFTKLTDAMKSELDTAIAKNSSTEIADVLSKAIGTSKHTTRQLNTRIVNILNAAKSENVVPTLSQVASDVRSMNTLMAKFGAEKSVLDGFISARVGDRPGTYIANQWGRVGNKFIKLLNLNSKELKNVSQGDLKLIESKLVKLAENDIELDKAIDELTRLIDAYDSKAGSSFLARVRQKSKDVCEVASSEFQAKGFKKIAEKLSSTAKVGTLENTINSHAAERTLGAYSSYRRLLQSLEVLKKARNGQLASEIHQIMIENKMLENVDKQTSNQMINELVEAAKEIMLHATTTDYVEKLDEATKYKLDTQRYKVVMQALFGNSIDDELELARKEFTRLGKENIDELVAAREKELLGQVTDKYSLYKHEMHKKVVNWINPMTPGKSRGLLTQGTKCANAVERNNLIGKPMNNLVQDLAKQTYNSQKWLKIFGGAMVALTAVTLVAGLFLGRKSKMEKQVEAESKVNG